MKIFLLEAFNGESGYFVIADSGVEAVRLAKQYYLKENKEPLTTVEIFEQTEIRKGVFGHIDWTEPEPPIFQI